MPISSAAMALLDELRTWQLSHAEELLRARPALRDDELLAAVQAATLRRLFERLRHDQRAPPELLGQAYELLLGKLLVRGKGAIALRNDPQKRKTAGAFYTPRFVVDYIVEQTLGAWLEGKTTEQAATLCVLDPACGCGWFLVAAYRYLCRWFLERRQAEDAANQAAKMTRGADGRWRLVAAERLAILQRHVFGVELDGLAAEAARLTLLLALQEDAGDECNAGDSGRACVERNIKAGNALDDARFDWAQEFPAVFGRPKPGFTVIVGNPPYRRELAFKKQLDALAATALGRKFRAPRMDLWYYFLHLALERLLSDQGLLSFITNSYWSSGRGAGKLIAHLRSTAWLEEIFDLDDLPIFPGVRGRHMIFRLRKQQQADATRIKVVRRGGPHSAEPDLRGQAAVTVFAKTAAQLYRGLGLDLQPPADDWLAKLQTHPPLAEWGVIRQGIAENPAAVNAKTNRRFAGQWRVGEGVFSLTAAEVSQLALTPDEQALLRPYHDLCDLGRYRLAAVPSRMLIYSTRHTCPDIERCPGVAAHLTRFRAIMAERRETRQGKRAWWHLHWPREETLWQTPKIIALQMAPRPAFVPAERPVYVPFSANVFVPRAETREHLYYLAALLNSRVLWKWQLHHAKRRGVNLELNGHALGQTPIRRIDFASPADRQRHDRLVELVGKMLPLVQAGPDAESEHCVADIDAQIDALVCELYGLNADEIALVAADTARKGA